MEQKYIQTAINYKKNIAGKFVLVEGAKLKQRIDGEHFYVTRKIDGHLQVLFYSEGQTLMLNANGKEKANGLKCINLFSEALKQAGVKQAVIAAELYMPRRIIYRDKIPTSATGKVDNVTLKKEVLAELAKAA